MRVKISLKGKGQIPFNYNLALAGAVYGPIKRIDPDLAYSIHSSANYKFFTFSFLQIPKRKITENGIYILDGAYFFVSSPIKEIIHCFVEGVLEKPEVVIDKVHFDVESVEILKHPHFNGKDVFSTLSPIIVRTAEEENGNLRIIDLYPTNPKFYENLKNNLFNKYEALYHDKREDISISFSKPFSTKCKRIQIKNTHHRASFMVFEAEGDTELLELGYETGFGEKNSMGFGMVKITRRNPTEKEFANQIRRS